MAIHNPPHPGGIVKRQCLEPLGLTVTRATEGLGVTRQALSELVNERTGVSVEMAIRLSKAFGSTPETWLGMQTAYDLWQARGPRPGDRGRALCGGVMHEVAASKRRRRLGPVRHLGREQTPQNMSERPATRRGTTFSSKRSFTRAGSKRACAHARPRTPAQPGCLRAPGPGSPPGFPLLSSPTPGTQGHRTP